MAKGKRARDEKSQISNNKKQKTSSQSRETRAVPIDKLQWKEVALPERMEDAEGFFGLEEIEDVDVVRDADKGTVQYRVGKMNIFNHGQGRSSS